MTKSFAPSVERNKEPIFDILKKYISKGKLLEIGSGNGQHAVYFAEKLPQVQWTTSDTRESQTQIKLWLKEAQLKNLLGPVVLKVGNDDFPKGAFDYVFTANTLHIMSWKENKCLFKLLGKRLREGSLAFFYGPFNYNGNFTSDSNEQFNKWLKERDLRSGIRNFEDVNQSMVKFGFKFLEDFEMPANNRLLVFERLPFMAK
ncbi:MAG: DUF938 domain-containing protein [Halobacteriovoraceae bacterium]|nr:DUF938 domain-containing protein [Halobacteriovoraceae bacterium]